MTTMPPPPPPPPSYGSYPPPAGSYQPPVAPQQPQPPAKKSGCLKWTLIGCSVIIVLGVAFVAVITLVVFGAIKSTDAYKQSLAKVQSDTRVQTALGTPIKAGWYVTGHVNFENRKGGADIDYPVSGPNGDAKVHVEASKDQPDQPWDFSEITVTPSNGPPIDVLKP